MNLKEIFDELDAASINNFCIHLLRPCEKFWHSFSSTPTNLNFFDGVMTMYEIPANALAISYQYLAYPKDNKSKQNAKELIFGLSGIFEASYWGEIKITDHEEKYLSGVYHILLGVMANKKVYIYEGADLILKIINPKDLDKIDINKVLNEVRQKQLKGEKAPDVD